MPGKAALHQIELEEDGYKEIHCYDPKGTINTMDFGE